MADDSRAFWLTGVAGAVVGGLIAGMAGRLAASLGGVCGALVAWAGWWVARRPWPPAVRWSLALLIWGIGLALLLLAGGFAAAVQGLVGGTGPPGQ